MQRKIFFLIFKPLSCLISCILPRFVIISRKWISAIFDISPDIRIRFNALLVKKAILTIDSRNNNVLFTDSAVIPRPVRLWRGLMGESRGKNLKHGFPIKTFGNDEKADIIYEMP